MTTREAITSKKSAHWWQINTKKRDFLAEITTNREHFSSKYVSIKQFQKLTTLVPNYLYDDQNKQKKSFKPNISHGG